MNQIPVDSKYKDQAQKSRRQEKQKEQAGANEKEKKKEERTTKIQKLNTDQKTKKALGAQVGTRETQETQG